MASILDEMDRDLSGDTGGALEAAASRFGLRKSSGLRSPSRNRAAGGAKNSYHLSGQAGDFAGSPDAMKAFHSYAKDAYGDRLEEAIYGSGDHRDHVHVAWKGPDKSVIADMDRDLGKAKPQQKSVLDEMDRELGAGPKAQVQAQIDELRTNQHVAPRQGQPMGRMGELREMEGTRQLEAPDRDDPAWARRPPLQSNLSRVAPAPGAITSIGELRREERNLDHAALQNIAVEAKRKENERRRVARLSRGIIDMSEGMTPPPGEEPIETLEQQKAREAYEQQQQLAAAQLAEKRASARKRGDRGPIAAGVRGAVDRLAPGLGGLVDKASEDTTNVVGALSGGVADLVTGAANIAPYGAGQLKPVADLLLRPVREGASKLSGEFGESTAVHGREGLIGDVTKGIAGSAPMIAAGMAAGPAAPLVVAGMGAAQTTGSIYNEARQAGLSEQDAGRVALLGIPIGLTEMWGIGGLPGKHAKGLLVRNFIKGILAEAGEEATQETVQQTLTNLTAQGFYDPQRGTFKDVGYGAVVAAITGGTMGAGFQTANVGRKRAAEPVDTQPVGERGKSASPAGQPPAIQPETAEALTAQLEELKAGQKKALLIAPGEKLPVDKSEMRGFVSTHVEGVGTFWHDPEVVSQKSVARAARAGRHGELLGDVEDRPAEGAVQVAEVSPGAVPAPPGIAPSSPAQLGVTPAPTASVPVKEPVSLTGVTHHSQEQNRDVGKFAPGYPPEVRARRRQSIYDKLTAARRMPETEQQSDEDRGLFQASGLSTVEYDRVVAKLADLKSRGEDIESYLRQPTLTGEHELNPAQQTLLRELAAPKTRKGPVAEKQEGLFETAPTVESRQAQEKESGGFGGLFGSGGLFQADNPESRNLMNDVVDELVADGVTSFKDAARKFRDEFSMAGEYGEIFEAAWDAHKGTTKRGKQTFEGAVTEKTKAPTSLLTAIRRAGGIKSTESDVANYFSNKEGSTSGLVTKNGRSVEDMVDHLREEGFILPGYGPMAADEDAAYDRSAVNPVDSLLEAMEAEQRGKGVGTYEDANLDESWEQEAREEFAEKADHSIMSRAFDNPASEEYKAWVEAYDGALNPRRQPTDEDIQFFKETSRELGLSDETINRHLSDADERRRNEAILAEGAPRDESGQGTPVTDAASLRDALVNVWGQSPENAEATAALAQAFDQTYSKLSGEPEGTIFGRLRVAAGGKAEGLMEAARAATQFLHDGTAVIRALQNPNESTAAHELHHGVIGQFFDLSERLRTSGNVQSAEAKQFIRDMDNMATWMGLGGAARFNELHTQYVASALKGSDLRRYVNAQEKAARGFEKYLRTGKAPTPTLQAVFDRFKEWLRDIYLKVSGSEIDIKIGREQRATWDRLLGGTGKIAEGGTQAKQERINEERAQRGDEEIEKDGVRHWGPVWAEAKAAVAADQGTEVRKMAAEVAQQPRVLNDAEQARLVADRVSLKNRYDAAEARGLKAIQENDIAERVDADAELELVQQALLDNDMALFRAGSEWGRAGRFRQLQANQDYTYERAVNRSKIKSGKTELPQDVLDKLKKLTDAYATAQEEIAIKNTELESYRAAQAEANRQEQQGERVGNWGRASKKKARAKEVVLADMEALRTQFAKLAGESGGLYQRDSKQAGQTETAAFRKWFGESKVVDKKGKPLVVYTGTYADFKQFKVGKEGVFFTASPKVASSYASFGDGEGGNVVPAFLSLENPLIVVDPDPGRRTGANYYDIMQGDLRRQALAGGHDGIIVRAIRGRKDESMYVAFRPEQIKSATGNRGTFDPDSPNILYQAASVRDEPLNSELRKLVKQFARLSVEAGARTPEDVNAQVHGMVSQHFPDVTPRQTADIWSEYGKKSVLSQEEIDVALREVKGLQRLLAAKEDVEAGEVPQRSGPQRDKPTQRHRQLMREINTKLRELGLWKKSDVDPDEQWKTREQAFQTRLRNQIQDIEKQIETGVMPEPGTSGKPAVSPETQALIDQRDALKKVLQETEGFRKAEIERRIVGTERALERAIDRMKANVTSKPKTSSAWSGRISELTAERDALRKAAQPERSLKAYKSRTEKRIADLQTKLNEGDYAKPVRNKLVYDDEALKLGATAKRLTAQINAAIAKQERSSLPDIVTSGRQTLMLANLLGTAKDVLSTTGHNIAATIQMIPEAMLDSLQSLRTKERVDVALGPGGLVGAIVKGLKEVPSEAKEIARYGLSSRQAAEWEIPYEINTGGKILDNTLKAVGRYRSIADLPNWQVGYEIGRRAKSLAMAKTEKRQNKTLDVKARAQEIYDTMSVADLLDVQMDTATAIAKTEAKQIALERTFKQKNAFSDFLSKGVMNRPWSKAALRLALAFDKSMSNYIKTGFDMSGAGVFTGTARALLNLAQGRRESLWFKSKGEAEQATIRNRQHKANLAFGRGIVGGGGGLLLGYTLASLGAIGDPEDEEIRRKGWSGALYFGDYPVDLGWLGPLAVPLSMGAGLYYNQTSGMRRAGFQSLKQAPLVRGTKQIADWMNVLDRKSDESFSEGVGMAAGRQVTSVIPGFVKETARFTDGDRDVRVKGEGFFEAFMGPIKGAFPGWRGSLPEPSPRGLGPAKAEKAGGAKAERVGK